MIDDIRTGIASLLAADIDAPAWLIADMEHARRRLDGEDAFAEADARDDWEAT